MPEVQTDSTTDILASDAFTIGWRMAVYALYNKPPGWVPMDILQVLLDVVEGRVDLMEGYPTTERDKDVAARILRAIAKRRVEHPSPFTLPISESVQTFLKGGMTR